MSILITAAVCVCGSVCVHVYHIRVCVCSHTCVYFLLQLCVSVRLSVSMFSMHLCAYIPVCVFLTAAVCLPWFHAGSAKQGGQVNEERCALHPPGRAGT